MSEHLLEEVIEACNEVAKTDFRLDNASFVAMRRVKSNLMQKGLPERLAEDTVAVVKFELNSLLHTEYPDHFNRLCEAFAGALMSVYEGLGNDYRQKHKMFLKLVDGMSLHARWE